MLVDVFLLVLKGGVSIKGLREMSSWEWMDEMG